MGLAAQEVQKENKRKSAEKLLFWRRPAGGSSAAAKASMLFMIPIETDSFVISLN